MGIQQATDRTFDELVLGSPRPVLVDFWAAWAEPCKQLAPEIEALAATYEGAIGFVTVDVDANPRIAAALAIQSVPTIAFYQPDRHPQGIVGYRPAAQIEEAFGLTRWLPTTEPAPAPASPDALAEIGRLGDLRDRGVLSEDEFAALKARLLAAS